MSGTNQHNDDDAGLHPKRVHRAKKSDQPPSAPESEKTLSFWAELSRRKVIRAASVYLAVAAALIQVGSVVFPIINAPAWSAATLLMILILAFPPLLIFTWVFDLTSTGLIRTQALSQQVERTTVFRRRLLIGSLIVAAFSLFVLFFRADLVSFVLKKQAPIDNVRNVVAINPNTIAVIPFVNLSKDADNEYFSDGLSEQMLNALAQIPELHVAGRTSVFSFKGRNEDVRVIGEKLGVSNVLQGSVAKSGNKIRITAQLAKTADGFQIWSQTFDRELNDIFLLQDEITAQVVRALKLKLLPHDVPSSARTSNAEAYNQYLLGHNYYKQGTQHDWELAIKAFESAIHLDPNYAPPHAEMAESLDILADFANTQDEVAQKKTLALQSANRAIALAPNMADGYTARARVKVGALDFAGAADDVKKALELNPGDARNLQRYAQSLMRRGLLTEAFTEVSKAIALDPLADNALLFAGIIQIASGQYDSAQHFFERALQVAPNHFYVQTQLGISYLLQDDLTRAQTIFEQHPAEFWRAYGMALLYSKQNKTKEMSVELAKLVENDAFTMAFQIAEVFAWSGQQDKAITWLQRAYQQKDGGLEFIKTAPLLQSVRHRKEFVELERRLGLPKA